MKPTITRGATHNFHAPKNWDAATMGGECGVLQVRAETFGKAEVVELISTWKPSEGELAILREGGVIEIGLCQATQPPMSVNVVDPVNPALVKYLPRDETADQRKPAITINEDGHGF
jgi:hypothetical protein